MTLEFPEPHLLVYNTGFAAGFEAALKYGSFACMYDWDRKGNAGSSWFDPEKRENRS